MSAERRQQRFEQARPVNFELKLAPKRSGATEAVAQQRQIARASTPGCEPCKRACKIRQCLERAPDAVAPDRILVQPGDEPKPLLDLALSGERCTDVLGEQSAARRGLAAVDLAE
jgi:hypothetical protein